MSRIDEELTEQFYRWELLGRGWQTFDQTVRLEPPFRPFLGHFLPRLNAKDDGRRHTILSSLAQRFFGGARQELREELHEELHEDSTPEPKARAAEELQECQVALPLVRSVQTTQIESFLRRACRSGEPLAFEIVATDREIIPQFVAPTKSLRRAEHALESSYPGTVATQVKDTLDNAWRQTGSMFGVIELGLGKEFMLPLGKPQPNLLCEIVAALDALEQGELGLLQIHFEPLASPWEESVFTAVTDGNEKPFFINRSDLLAGALQKISAPLFGVVIRLAASAHEIDRVWEIISDMAVVFSAVDDPSGNHLVPLDNAGYPIECHEIDFLNRLSRRSGMILNLEELSHLVSLPVSSPSTRLRRNTVRTKAAPALSLRDNPLMLGLNNHAGVANVVSLGAEERVRHLHVIGASGTGKSTLLFNLIRQDIEHAQGIAVLDPHGDLIDRILGIIPSERHEDVVLLDPADEEYSVGFNILSAHSDLEKTLLASDLVSVFERLSTSWGDQMNSVFRNAILAFLESSRGGTLSDLRRFLVDPAYRKAFLKFVEDPEVTYYWETAFPHLSGNRSVGPVLTRLDAFLSPKPIRRIVSERTNKLDFAGIMDSGKILLVKLAQGQIGRENAYLLGSLFMAKLQQIAMSRQRQAESSRRDFWIYLDEFHNFITPSMAEILTGARKYRVGLTLAHQELRQLGRDPEVASAVLSNPYTRVIFRVGDADARALESGLSFFEARDLQNLGTGEAICRIERSDFDFNLAVLPESDCESETADETRRRVIVASRQKYGIPRAEADAALLEALETPKHVPAEKTAKKTPSAPIVGPSEPETTTQPNRAPPTVTATEKCESTPPQATDNEQSVSPPPDLGRGGAQHQAIQQRLKSAAENFGYRAIVEKPVLDGQGSVDLVLEKNGWQIACEISVTTTIDHEVGNVRKCLKAGFPSVAVICPKAARLEQLKSAVEGCFDPDAVSRLLFCSTEDFIVHLEQCSVEATNMMPTDVPPQEERRRGYKIKRSYVELTPEEMKGREEAALKALAETMRRKTKTK